MAAYIIAITAFAAGSAYILAKVMCLSAAACECASAIRSLKDGAGHIYNKAMAMAADIKECKSAIESLKNETRAYKVITAELREAEMSCFRQMCTLSERLSKYEEISRDLSDATVEFKLKAADMDNFIRRSGTGPSPSPSVAPFGM